VKTYLERRTFSAQFSSQRRDICIAREKKKGGVAYPTNTPEIKPESKPTFLDIFNPLLEMNPLKNPAHVPAATPTLRSFVVRRISSRVKGQERGIKRETNHPIVLVDLRPRFP
jgi:hypothetical protein